MGLQVEGGSIQKNESICKGPVEGKNLVLLTNGSVQSGWSIVRQGCCTFRGG